MMRPPPRASRTDTLVPVPARLRSVRSGSVWPKAQRIQRALSRSLGLIAWHQAELTRRDSLVRYAYGITAALLAGGAAATLALQQPVGAQAPQNQPGAISAATPRDRKSTRLNSSH